MEPGASWKCKAQKEIFHILHLYIYHITLYYIVYFMLSIKMCQMCERLVFSRRELGTHSCPTTTLGRSRAIGRRPTSRRCTGGWAKWMRGSVLLALRYSLLIINSLMQFLLLLPILLILIGLYFYSYRYSECDSEGSHWGLWHAKHRQHAAHEPRAQGAQGARQQGQRPAPQRSQSIYKEITIMDIGIACINVYVDSM